MKRTRVKNSVFSLAFGGTLLAVGVLTGSLTEPVEAQTRGFVDPAELAKLGKQLFRDTTLSEPAGMACVSCHDPEAGFSFPDSNINLDMGPVPGIVPGRFGFRKPPTVSYITFLPEGPPHIVKGVEEGMIVGGLFMDGHAANATEQAKMPFVGPNEMNNLTHDLPDQALVVSKIKKGPSAQLFKKVYGPHVFEKPVAVVYDLMAKAIAAYEASDDVSPFTSKYDAWLEGKATLTPQELKGLRLATGRFNGRPDGLPFPINAHCMDCHGISSDLTKAKDLWTNSCYVNLGVPRNKNNPFYKMTDPTINPVGYNPLGEAFVDYGLGMFIYPQMGKSAGDLEENDPFTIDGLFRAPTLRNVDKRPYSTFVKSYMHNGALKSLKEVVHFYNTRNLTTVPGEVIDFTKPDPYAGLAGTPLWDAPEWPSPRTLNNPKGNPGGEEEGIDGGGEAEIGNLMLTEDQENDIVAFLRTLSDGYFKR